jgi:uncharacterized membrane protein
LWRIALGPLIFVAHFVLTYAGASVVCAKLIGEYGWAMLFLQVSIGAITVLALAGIAWAGWRSWRQWDYFDDYDYVHDRPIEEDRHEFLGHAAFLLALVSAIAVTYVGLPAIYVAACH